MLDCNFTTSVAWIAFIVTGLSYSGLYKKYLSSGQEGKIEADIIIIILPHSFYSSFALFNILLAN
jgi:hypothetical protein